MKRSCALAVALVAFAGSAAAVHAQNITVIYSEIATSSTSLLPGGAPGVRIGEIDRPYVSPDGQFWIVQLDSAETSPQTRIVRGTGLNGAGATTIVTEGDVFDLVPGATGLTYNFFRDQMGVNNAGQVAFGADLNGTSSGDDVVVRYDGPGSYTLMAREATQAPGQAAGVGFGSAHDGVHILADGTVRFRSSALTTATTQMALYSSTNITTGTVLAQTDQVATQPTGQLTAPDQTIDVLTTGRFTSSSDGSVRLFVGDLNGPTTTDLFIARNGVVLAQEGSVLPGSSFSAPVLDFTSDANSQMVSHNGQHIAFRGTNNDPGQTAAANRTDWVWRNGTVIATTDAPIVPGSTELWDDTSGNGFGATFFLNAINGLGDIVIGGTTNNADGAANGVLVYNGSLGTFVVVREGQAVDVDGNGVFDDDAFVGIFGNDDAFLTDTGRLYFQASLRDSTGASRGSSFLSIQVPTPGAAALLGLAGLVAGRRRRA